ncbi:MAG: flagellin [Butyrivibrio sp.]
MRVNCNISAMVANTQLGKTETALDRAIERLSSGLRINKAEDDAAGMAISKKMHTQIKALEQANRNASDGISVVQTAESALAEIENMLQRMRELAVQGADDTYSAEDKTAIQAEINQLVSEVDRIATDTEFNSMPLLDGTLSRRAYADVNNVYMIDMSDSIVSGEYSFSVDTAATRASLTVSEFTGTITEEEAGIMTINGAQVIIEAGQDFDTVYQNIIDVCNGAGATVENGAAGTFEIKNRLYGSREEISIKFRNEKLAQKFNMAENNVAAGEDCTVTLKNGFSATAAATADGGIITIKDVNDFEMVIEVPGDSTITECTMKVTEMGIMDIQVGANEGQQMKIDIPKVSSHILGIDALVVTTPEGAGIAISKIDDAITEISSIRSMLGAYQNRLENSVESLNSYSENITSALSRIEDCDMAEEMTNYSAQNVISQAATSVLAQANERPQSILQLLQ